MSRLLVAVAVAVAVAGAVAGAGACRSDPATGPTAPGGTTVSRAPVADSTPTPDAASQAPAPDPDDESAPGVCGSETCALDQFCEDLYKGHDSDVRGRPLHHRKCMPLPEPCRAAPSCACVTKQVAATHCSEKSGRVYLDDYPVRR